MSDHPGDERERQLRAALSAVAANAERPYHDETSDRAARARYYDGIAPDAGPALYHALSQLLEATHQPRLAYNPAERVYPWVDLHPDRQLHSIYSGKHFAPEDLIRADFEVLAAREERLQDVVRRGFAVGPRELEAAFDALEAELPFNCEHVVPQSWFAKREPMRGDLHHLFACEPACNSFRGNSPYFEFPALREAVREECGRRDEQGFDPAGGRGPIARATMYFLLRYPGLVGDAPQELHRDRLELLLRWHASDPVSSYERHRNAAIAELQGNRNPTIDNPDWVTAVDFDAAWAH